jgi:hypothetical protein
MIRRSSKLPAPDPEQNVASEGESCKAVDATETRLRRGKAFVALEVVDPRRSTRSKSLLIGEIEVSKAAAAIEASQSVIDERAVGTAFEA